MNSFSKRACIGEKRKRISASSLCTAEQTQNFKVISVPTDQLHNHIEAAPRGPTHALIACVAYAPRLLEEACSCEFIVLLDSLNI